MEGTDRMRCYISPGQRPIFSLVFVMKDVMWNVVTVTAGHLAHWISNQCWSTWAWGGGLIWSSLISGPNEDTTLFLLMQCFWMSCSVCFLHRWRFTFYLYIFTFGVRFLKKVTNLFWLNNWWSLWNGISFMIDKSIHPLFCFALSLVVSIKHSDLLSSREALFYSQHYQIDAASQLFIYLFGITTRKCSSTLRVFLGFAFHQLLGFCGSNTQTRWSQREMSALIWFLVSYGASRHSIHKLSFSALPLIKPFIIHYSIHNADYFPPSKHVQKNFDSSMKQLNKTDSLVVYWTSCCSRLELHSISHMDLNEAYHHQSWYNFTAFICTFLSR